MIFFKRRRLLTWLLKAYFKKWRKTIFISFIVGLAVFFILKFGVNYFIPLIPFTQEETVGLVGAYTTDDLPSSILANVSKGLTETADDDSIKPALASSWDIQNNGKRYVFHLQKNVSFSDGTKLTSDQIKYNFLNVSIERPDPYTIIFNLKDAYSPFLVTVTRPIFRNGFIGIGDYKVNAISLNGNFVQSLSLVSVKGKNKEIVYQFYPTEDSLKTALALADIDKITGVRDLNIDGKNFTSFKNLTITKYVDYSSLVTVFYNTQDRILSDKRLREALAYAMPNNFSYGQRNYGPFSPKSWANQDYSSTYQQDFQHAKLLLNESGSSSSGAALKIELKTLERYKNIAYQIKSLWEKIGIETNIKVVDALPTTFQVFLGEFNVTKDPDQYTLWHSSQINLDNITNYKNLRIDKLLEDGRQTDNISERKKIYADFQKYLLDDAPATFLYFPYEYEITKK
jgi:peptide/nickel transport system substrate-binding protein